MRLRALAILIVLAVWACPASATVIFSDDFEWGADWSSAQALPSGSQWDSVTVSDFGGSYENIHVNAAGAKVGSRGMTQYWDNTGGTTQESWISNENLSLPAEFYLGYWYKVDPSWGWGSAASLKLWKIHFSDGSTFDMYWSNFCAYCGPEYCNAPSGDRVVCTGHSGMNNENNHASWNAIAGGQWHYFVWHFNHNDDTLTLEVDGVAATNTSYTSSWPGTGFDATYGLHFGGNLTAGGGAVNEMYTCHDQLIIATTKQEVLDFLQSGGGGDLPDPTGTVLNGGTTVTGSAVR